MNHYHNPHTLQYRGYTLGYWEGPPIPIWPQFIAHAYDEDGDHSTQFAPTLRELILDLDNLLDS